VGFGPSGRSNGSETGENGVRKCHQGQSRTLEQMDSRSRYLWQSHFSVDLLVHSILFSCWVVYRESSCSVAFICAICSIVFGAVFSFLYLLVVFYINKGDLFLVINGSKRTKA